MAFIGGITNPGPQDAYGLVNEAWDHYRNLGDNWIAQSRTAIANLDSIHVEPINFSVDYNVESWLPQFIRPLKPTTPTFGAVTFSPPALPTLDPVAMRDLGDAPAEPDFSSMAQYAPPAPPNMAVPQAPSDVVPVLDPVVVPLAPDYVLPEVPTFYALDLPATPVINLPAFDAAEPVFDLQMPTDGELDFVEVPHDLTLQNALKAQINHMMQGGTGLPLAVEQAMFDRGRAREDRLSRKQSMEVAEDMAARGLSEPNGLLAARLREVHADNREKVAGLNRDLTVRVAEIGVENIRFAVGQGMALEQTLIQQNQAINERALKVATYLRDYAIQRLNAQIAYVNLQHDAYATKAQVWRTQIEGELAKLEVMKSQIEGQRLVGEVNKQLVERYEAGVRAVGALSDAYRNDVEAAKVRSEINVQRLEGARLILQRYDTEVKAWGEVQNGYRTQVEAALGTTRFAESMANVFATRMQGYKTRGDAYFREGEFHMQRNAQRLDLFRSELAGAELGLRGQMATLDSQIKSFEAEVGLYQADGSIAQAESAALDRATSLRIENEKNRIGAALQQAQIRIEQAMKIGEILVEQVKAKAAAIAQLAAASQSGVNFGASISGSMSQSFSKSAGVSWNGEAADYNGLTPNMNF